jgi:glucose uptake protein GlcU
MWGVANCSFFIANNALSQAIAFPIVASGPPVIASLYGIFLYKEITGKRNFIILSCGFTFAIVGSLLCGLSK